MKLKKKTRKSSYSPVPPLSDTRYSVSNFN